MGLKTNLPAHRQHEQLFEHMDKHEHLPYAFVDLSIFSQCLDLARGKLQHPNVTLLGRYGCFDHVDFTLSICRLGLDLESELYAQSVITLFSDGGAYIPFEELH